ncbi:MAG: acetyl-CoA carboxylase biotin carboxyl carrier protein subunit [Bacteroidales bacterium]|nr:acetyl-CoA carboxylase biotin carboxyl carrier protein subunit [Bacteroidales bacterium]MBO7648609.1 acetyl-CoA carboxylase biotin carboxyl carrier protein subunit [Bacteroidales bacterium]MCR4856624.1 acetyl-CoA carboxylase biotin carboxyl carrier protein subunit [Bacteroidales bacterium]
MKNYKFTINGNKYSVEVGDINENVVDVEINGSAYKVELDTELKAPARVKPVVHVNTSSNKAAAPAAATANVKNAPAAATAAGATLKSPLPGTILDVFCKPGDAVKAGQRLFLLEAMKMENNIDAEKDGVIKEVRVHRSDSVMEGDILVVFE